MREGENAEKKMMRFVLVLILIGTMMTPSTVLAGPEEGESVCFVVSGVDKDYNNAFKDERLLQAETSEIAGRKCIVLGGWEELKFSIRKLDEMSGEKKKNIFIYQGAHGNRYEGFSCNSGNTSAESVIQILRNLAKERKVGAVLDSCFAGSALSSMVRSQNKGEWEDTEVSNLCMISASLPDQISFKGTLNSETAVSGMSMQAFFKAQKGGLISSFPFNETELLDAFQEVDIPFAFGDHRNAYEKRIALKSSSFSGVLNSLFPHCGEKPKTLPAVLDKCDWKELNQAKDKVLKAEARIKKAAEKNLTQESRRKIMQILTKAMKEHWGNQCVWSLKYAFEKNERTIDLYQEIIKLYRGKVDTVCDGLFPRDFPFDDPKLTEEEQEAFKEIKSLFEEIIEGARERENALNTPLAKSGGCIFFDVFMAAKKELGFVIDPMRPDRSFHIDPTTNGLDLKPSGTVPEYIHSNLDLKLSPTNKLDRLRRKACEEFKF